jgi:hypothetical protein
MYIRCPKCGRRGYLPDRLVPEANSLRCRKCRAHFMTPELSHLAVDRGGGPAFDATEAVGVAVQPAAFLADGFFGGFDDEAGSPRERGPGDSNYELTFTLQDIGSDSDTHWDASHQPIEPEAPSSDEIAAVTPAGREAESWPVRFVAAWAAVWIRAALGLIAASAPVIAYLLWRAAGDAGPSPALIAGFACAVGLVMLSIPTMLLAACLTDLTRDVRRLREHIERPTGRGD